MLQFRTTLDLLNMAGGVVALAAILYAAQPWHDTSSGYLGLIGFVIWVLLPFLAVNIVKRFLGINGKREWVFLIASLCSLGIGIFYFIAITTNTSSTGGLIFLVFPGYHLLLVLSIPVLCLFIQGEK